MITGRRADRLPASARRTLKTLAGLDDPALDDPTFFRLLAERVAEAVRADKATVGILEGAMLQARGSHGFPTAAVEEIAVHVDREAGTGMAERVLFGDMVFI